MGNRGTKPITVKGNKLSLRKKKHSEKKDVFVFVCIYDCSRNFLLTEEDFLFTGASNKSKLIDLRETTIDPEMMWQDYLENYKPEVEREEITVDTEEKEEEEMGYLQNPIPGQPCDNPSEAGWDMEHIVDVRENFSWMSYIPEEGTEDDTYLLGKTKSYTLYGKGKWRKCRLFYGKYGRYGCFPYGHRRVSDAFLL